MAAGSLPEGTATVMVTDVEASTALMTRLGDELGREALRLQHQIVEEQVATHGGEVVDLTGDGAILAFGSARRAILCALDIQRAIEAHSRRDPTRGVRLRIGLNSGEMTEVTGKPSGAATHGAVRVAAKATGGEILVSEVVRLLTGTVPDVSFVPRGRFQLKGFEERWQLYGVVREDKASVGLDRTPLVGRHAELAELDAALSQAASGMGSTVLLRGEPGVGKTRLAEELMDLANRRGMRTILGHCHETAAVPYMPFVEILESVCKTLPREDFRSTLGDAAPEVALIAPEIRRMFPDLASAVQLPADQERRYLFNSLWGFIDRLARLRPLLLVVDDLHWADDSTLLFLRHIAPSLQGSPVLVVITYRDIESDMSPLVPEVTQDLLRRARTRRVHLGRLPQEYVTEMLVSLGGPEPPRPIVGTIYSESEGNPFFVEEVFRYLSEEKKLFDDSGHWNASVAVGDDEVPEGARLLIGRRLERLDERTVAPLGPAALMGREFGFDLLQSVVPDGTDLVDAMEAAERAHLISPVANGREARFMFVHELTRQTVIRGLSPRRRQQLHLSIGEEMEKLTAGSLDEHAVQLAHHFYQAGTTADPHKTVYYLERAGEQALDAAAFEDALRHFESALPLIPEDSAGLRADVLFKLGLTRRALSDMDGAIDNWRAAMAAYEALGDHDGVVRVGWEAANQLGWAFRMAESAEFVARGMGALGDRKTPEGAALQAGMGVVQGWMGDHDGATATGAQALKVAEELGDRRGIGQALYAEALLGFYYMQPSRLLEAGARAAELFRAERAYWDLALALLLVWMGHLQRGDQGQESNPIVEELRSYAKLVGGILPELLARRLLAFMAVRDTGDLRAFERSLQEQRELSERAGPWLVDWYVTLGLVKFRQGKWKETRDLLYQAIDLQTGAGALMEFARPVLFLCLAYDGQREDAFGLLKQYEDALAKVGQVNTYNAWSFSLMAIEGLYMLGERESVAEQYPLALEALKTGSAIRFDSRLLDVVAGIAATAAGQWEAAERHYRSALAAVDSLSMRLEQPEVRRFFAQMLIERDRPGDHSEAERLVREAIDQYTQIGMPKHVDLCRGLL